MNITEESRLEDEREKDKRKGIIYFNREFKYGSKEYKLFQNGDL